MRYLLLAMLLALSAERATAQGPFVYKPIDTSKAVVATDNVAAVASGATRSTLGTVTRSIGSAIENNGYVKTINNLFGKRYKPQAPQAGFSALPQANMYHSTGYQNAFRPQLPVSGALGQTPNVIMPASPSPTR
ncbi:hypothetical protein BH11PLA2_BH11PLA2_51460 [soil metagenome]